MSSRITTWFLPVYLAAAMAGLLSRGAAHAELVNNAWIERTAIPEALVTREAQRFLLGRLPALEIPPTREAWETQAASLRQSVLQTVFLENVPDAWLTAPLNVVPGDQITHEGYTIRKLRYEAVPGLWIPAVLYEPANAAFPVPAVLNAGGHDYENGKAGKAEQARGINLARRGMLSLHPDWYSCGELNQEGYRHDNIARFDVLGVRGVSLFYFLQKRALEVLLADPRTDPSRVAMTGLSGGGCQTAFFSALDERIRLTVPVGGYGGLRPRIEALYDLGDIEQIPSDFLSVADYSHITALFAPRPALLIYNQYDECCFLPERTLPATYDPAVPAYHLFDGASKFRFHVNEAPGTHNYESDNRQRLYEFLDEHFRPGEPGPAGEAPFDRDLHDKEALYVGLPPDNATFLSLAAALLSEVSRPPVPDAAAPEFAAWQAQQRDLLARIVRPLPLHWETVLRQTLSATTLKGSRYELASPDWTLGLLYLAPAGADPADAVCIIADAGLAGMKDLLEQELGAGRQIIAFDPIFMGANKPNGPAADKLAIVFESEGVRVLGLQAGQIAAVLDWARRDLGITRVRLVCAGWNAATAGLAACADGVPGNGGVESITLIEAPESLDGLVTGPVKHAERPALFCYGLVKYFDLPGLAALCHPIPVLREHAGT